jgi:hypothetical protein
MLPTFSANLETATTFEECAKFNHVFLVESVPRRMRPVVTNAIAAIALLLVAIARMGFFLNDLFRAVPLQPQHRLF